jgi:Uma2 family endonuclease
MVVAARTHRFTAAEYHALGTAGILAAEDRVELIQGELVEMSPIGSRHAGTVNRLNQILSQMLSGRAVVSVQNPILLDDFSEPRPDLALLRHRDDFYTGGLPTSADVLLAVEVADSSLEYDRAVKIPLYAQAGLPEAWLLDLIQPGIDVHRGASPSGYREARRARPGETLSLLAFPELVLSVSALLGMK